MSCRQPPLSRLLLLPPPLSSLPVDRPLWPELPSWVQGRVFCLLRTACQEVDLGALRDALEAAVLVGEKVLGSCLKTTPADPTAGGLWSPWHRRRGGGDVAEAPPLCTRPAAQHSRRQGSRAATSRVAARTNTLPSLPRPGGAHPPAPPPRAVSWFPSVVRPPSEAGRVSGWGWGGRAQCAGGALGVWFVNRAGRVFRALSSRNSPSEQGLASSDRLVPSSPRAIRRQAPQTPGA